MTETTSRQFNFAAISRVTVLDSLLGSGAGSMGIASRIAELDALVSIQ